MEGGGIVCQAEVGDVSGQRPLSFSGSCISSPELPFAVLSTEKPTPHLSPLESPRSRRPGGPQIASWRDSI